MKRDDEIALLTMRCERDDARSELDRLRAEVASLNEERDMLGNAIADMAANAGMIDGNVQLSGPQLLMLCKNLTQQLAAANGRVEMLAGWLRKYGNHYRGPGEMCELLKHSDYPCTCGLDAALSNLNEDSAG